MADRSERPHTKPRKGAPPKTFGVGARPPVRCETRAEQLHRIASHFAQIASCVNQRTSEATLQRVLKETQGLCAAAAQQRSVGLHEATSWLSNVTMALKTWQEVWPRLGGQSEFRQAVAREATLWSRRLEALAKKA